MPISVKDTAYPLPGEPGQPSMSGRELIAIEEALGLDAMALLASLAPNTEAKPGYTRTKALYALAFTAVSRVDKVMTFERLLDEVSIDELDITAVEENPTEAASSAVEPEAE